ncbi:MAG: nucleotidyltransferase domain-containing protein [Nanoarchaeota archaeon]|nr:nucleotidyltransferase domain-containing protein [Nanoarchaeota archaeon]
MTKRVDFILSEILEEVNISQEELKEINLSLEEFLIKIKKSLKSLKLSAEVFVGGSFAKGTMIKKDNYDIDIFIKFDKKHKDISLLTEKILKMTKQKNIQKIHGSRDYFKIKSNEKLFFEVIPVKKIKNSKEAENITDLSHSHVKYIKRKVKSEKTLNEIKLAKAFCYANKCYGAESYISGFSGYSLEILIGHYKSFQKLIKVLSNVKDKFIIDVEKDYKNKNTILLDLNASKIQSPIILIDPTYKTRNVLAALSEKTFLRFQKASKKFLKNPSKEEFNLKKIEIPKNKLDKNLLYLEIKTNRQEGNIAGSKLLKFYNHLKQELEHFFEIKVDDFEYNESDMAKAFFIVGKNKEILASGPRTKDKEHVKKFKKKHKKTFVKKDRLYAKEKNTNLIKNFMKDWMKKNKKKMEEMSIKEMTYSAH